MSQPNPLRSKNERIFRGILKLFSVLAVTIAAAQLLLGMWAQHSFTQVEAIIATQAEMLAAGDGLYYDLNDFPFTVNPYGPIFYCVLAAFYSLGLPVLLVGRLISLAAFGGSVYIAARTTKLLTGDRYAAWTTGLLVGITANLLHWGGTGQTDSLALFFSILAFYLYLVYEHDGGTTQLVWCGLSIASAIFVKQSFLAAGCAVAVLMLWRHRKAGSVFVGLLATSGVLIALALNFATDGGYFDHGIRTNLNPFAFAKFADQANYFLLVSGCLLLIAGAAPAMNREYSQIHVYLAAAFVICALTASKVGADLNYQMETSVLLCIAAGWSLNRLDFFRLYFRNDPGSITLLQIPLILYLVLNVALSGRSLLQRAVFEQIHREHSIAMAPYLAPDAGRILSVGIDPLISTRKYIEVEPLIYTLLVNAGVVDPGPVRRALQESRFATVALYQNVFEHADDALGSEIPSLPPDHLQVLRENYRLVEHVDGPYLGGVYIYQQKSAALELEDSAKGLP